ncbi:PRMT5-domain-containing protein [Hygrophoropsis aurantiaca]|uniref:PRMT5-domain-containing protein n=1 Tax=Hygrophoropsis aurantiaca TaxID=72124 RepID=A0ACB8A3N3_9AGAM|nr:PRMT5-domain-containing protein [Hygrophoropsis aurantiaca]
MPEFAALASSITHEDISQAFLKGQGSAETPILRLLKESRSNGYDVTCLPLTTAKWRERWRDMCILPSAGGADSEKIAAAEQQAEIWRRAPGFALDEVTISRLDEAEGIVAMISDWLQLDSTDDWLRHDSEIALRQELAYASYLNVLTVILPPPRNRAHVASYARAVNECLKSTPYIQFSIRLPIYDPAVFQPKESPVRRSMDSFSSASSSSTSPRVPKLTIPTSQTKKAKPPKAPEGELNATWEMWDIIRTLCDYNTRLTLTLDLTPPLPSNLAVLSRWTAEPVQHIFLPASTFIANVKGYPVLPKGTQSFIRDSMTHRPTIILSGTSLGSHSKGGESAYSQYVRYLEKTSLSVQAARQAGTVENFAQGYQDFLQTPLQPLMDNLQSITYQTFEQDPVKYRNYEEAIFHALMDWPDSGRIVICVAGAGRGPLVARSLRAIDRSRRQAVVYAVEKNPNAYVTLQGRKDKEWGDSVELLFGDMRQINVPEQADILVSELLGSFGDNELSPECLDGAMRFLKVDGISIPSSYTAHLAPLSSSKLFNEARASKELKYMETPYVVMFQNVNILSGEGGGVGGRCGSQVQECWEFEHPRKDPIVDGRGLPLTNSHNARFSKMSFHIPHAGVLHGLAGYFEAVLYGDVGLSIHPLRKDQVSKDMLSWFPLFFPFRDPLYLPSNSELQVSIWRLTNQRQVWYEWYAESFLPVLNPPLPTEQLDNPLGSDSSFFACASTNVAVPSPLIDAVDAFPHSEKVESGRIDESPKSDAGIVKIGQTALHNPGGRSSWIGL